MRGWVLGAVVLAACQGTAQVLVANHSTAQNLEFVLQGSARRLEVFSCSDSTRVIWSTQAPDGGALSSRVTMDPSAVLGPGCYVARVVPGGSRSFEVKGNGLVVQQF